MNISIYNAEQAFCLLCHQIANPYIQIGCIANPAERGTVGYKELFAYFDGNCTLDEAVEQIKIHTRQYAKRQMTWLRKDTSYHWIMPEDFDNTISALRQALTSPCQSKEH